MNDFGLDLTLTSNIFILTEVTSVFKLLKQVVNERHLVGEVSNSDAHVKKLPGETRRTEYNILYYVRFCLNTQ